MDNLRSQNLVNITICHFLKFSRVLRNRWNGLDKTNQYLTMERILALWLFENPKRNDMPQKDIEKK